jgi:hypothetical protein
MTKYTARWECLDCEAEGTATVEHKHKTTGVTMARKEAVCDAYDHAVENDCHQRLARIFDEESEE